MNGGIPDFHRLDGCGIMPWAGSPYPKQSPTERQRALTGLDDFKRERRRNIVKRITLTKG
jgi:hypothetical protein